MDCLFTLQLTFPPSTLLYWGNSLAKRQEKVLGKKAFLKYLLSFNNIQSEIHLHVCFSKSKAYDTASLRLTHLICIKQYLDSEMLAQFCRCERHMHTLQIKNTLEIKKQYITQCQQYV